MSDALSARQLIRCVLSAQNAYAFDPSAAWKKQSASQGKGSQIMVRKSIQLGLVIVVLAVSAAAQTDVTNSNSGTTNAVPVVTESSTVGNSPIAVGGANVGNGRTDLYSSRDAAGASA
jgi:hypothetical protein